LQFAVIHKNFSFCKFSPLYHEDFDLSTEKAVQKHRFLFKYLLVALAVLQTPGDPAQSGRGDGCIFHNLGIGIAFYQKLGSIDSFCHIFHFLLGAKILQKIHALLFICNGTKNLAKILELFFLCHGSGLLG
jgi:hypothetical protein